MLTAPDRAAGPMSARSIGNGRSRDDACALAQATPSGRTSSRSRKLRFWKLMLRRMRDTASASASWFCDSGPTRPGRLASVPSICRNRRLTVLSTTEAARCTTPSAASRAVCRIRSSSRAVPMPITKSKATATKPIACREFRAGIA